MQLGVRRLCHIGGNGQHEAPGGLAEPGQERDPKRGMLMLGRSLRWAKLTIFSLLNSSASTLAGPASSASAGGLAPAFPATMQTDAQARLPASTRRRSRCFSSMLRCSFGVCRPTIASRHVRMGRTRTALASDRLCRGEPQCWTPDTEDPIDGYAPAATRSDARRAGDAAEGVPAAEARSALGREQP